MQPPVVGGEGSGAKNSDICVDMDDLVEFWVKDFHLQANRSVRFPGVESGGN